MTIPLACAALICSGVVLSVRYSVISGSNAPAATPRDAAAPRMRSRYAAAASTVVTGGTRLGIAIARRNCALHACTVSASTGSSRKWWWKSSGVRMVSVSGRP